MGGEEAWGSAGDIQLHLEGRGIDIAEVKPLYAMEAFTGEGLVMLEVSSPSAFYLYNRIDNSLFQITDPDNLAGIVECINDEARGLRGLGLEEA